MPVFAMRYRHLRRYSFNLKSAYSKAGSVNILNLDAFEFLQNCGMGYFSKASYATLQNTLHFSLFGVIRKSPMNRTLSLGYIPPHKLYNENDVVSTR